MPKSGFKLNVEEWTVSKKKKCQKCLELCKCGIVAKEYSAQECSFSEQVTVLGDYAMWGTAGSFHYIEAWKWQQIQQVF